MNYGLHPLCTFFPRMSEKEFSALVTDIKTQGLNHPITLFDGMILDGGNRYKACIEAGVEPEFVEYAGNDAVRFVLSENLERRHLDAGQRAAIVASVIDFSKTFKHGGTGANQYTEQSGTNTTLQKTADRAKESGVSEKTQRKADVVAKANPELAKQVGRGEISLNEATKQVAPQLLNKPKNGFIPEGCEDITEADGHDDIDPEQVFNELRAEISAKDALIASLQASDKDKEIYKLNQLVASLNDQVANLQKTIQHKNKEIERDGKILNAIGRELGSDDDKSFVRLIQQRGRGVA